jgi:hypothetical protein
MGHDNLKPIDSNFPVRSLGVFVTESGSKKFQKERMKKMVDYMATILRGKQITDKQVIYIFNVVIIPMLEYNLNDMTLTEKECNKIASGFIAIIKNKACLARTSPNALIYAKEVYRVCYL